MSNDYRFGKMESVVSETGYTSVASDGTLSQKLKRKRRKSKRSRNEFEQLNELGKGRSSPYVLNFVSKPECKILYKNISLEFIKWLDWQRRILICGLTEKCSKSLIRTLGTVVEPVLHKSFRGSTVFCINMEEQGSLLFSRRTTQMSILTPTPSGANPRYINSTPTLTRSDLDSRNERALASAHQVPAVTTEDSRGPCLPPIDSAKVSIVQKNIEYLDRVAHKHSNKDEIKSAPSQQFFPNVMNARSAGLGKICAAKNVLKLETLTQNCTSGFFKNRKLWSLSATSSSFLTPNGSMLLESFKSQLDIIYKWFSEWTDAEQGACILEILSVCQMDEVEYFSQCILQRLKDRADINRLPDHLMKEVFYRLSTSDILSAALVCKRWQSLANDQQLWKGQCRILGLRNDMPNIVGEIETAATGHVIDWKSSYGDLSLKIQERNARLEELKRLEEDERADCEEEDAEPFEGFGSQVSLTSPLDKESLPADEELGDGDDSSVVSGMTDFLNGDLGLIEDTVQQLSIQAKGAESVREDEFAFDIRPAVSTQAINKLSSAFEMESLFKYVSIDGIKTLKSVKKLQDHLEAVLTLQFDKKRLITGSADRTARLWDVRSGRKIHEFKGHKGGVRALCFDKEYIITGSWDTTIIVWSAVRFNRLRMLDEHKDCVSCLEMNDDFLVSGSHDRTVRIWRKHSWGCCRILKGHRGCVTCLCIVDKYRILTGGMDRIAYLWNITDGSCLRVFSGSSDIILTIKSYGDLVAAGAHNGDLLFWNINTGKCEGIVLAHAGPLHCISFHGTRFITGGGDQLLKEWDLCTCSCVRFFTGHRDNVLCAQVSSKRILSGSADGTIRIWNMKNEH